ncbi:MAG: hypothetical protein JKY10_01025, partial [Cohaesibacteraceae bacterium]|nr:hypothetical protein [Cohaesibacteraceae bacterium]
EAIGSQSGGNIGAPIGNTGYIIVTKEQAQNDNRQLEIKMGSSLGAPEHQRLQVTLEDLNAVAIRLAGGGVVDPPESGDGTVKLGGLPGITNAPPIIQGGGSGPVSMVSSDGNNASASSLHNTIRSTIALQTAVNSLKAAFGK